MRAQVGSGWTGIFLVVLGITLVELGWIASTSVAAGGFEAALMLLGSALVIVGFSGLLLGATKWGQGAPDIPVHFFGGKK